MNAQLAAHELSKLAQVVARQLTELTSEVEWLRQVVRSAAGAPEERRQHYLDEIVEQLDAEAAAREKTS